jgi:hypothetical protein
VAAPALIVYHSPRRLALTDERHLSNETLPAAALDLLRWFVSLGDNAEFGQIQRLAARNALAPGMAPEPFPRLRSLQEAIAAVESLAEDVDRTRTCRLHHDALSCPFVMRPAPALLTRQCALWATLGAASRVCIWKSNTPEPEAEVRALVAALAAHVRPDGRQGSATGGHAAAPVCQPQGHDVAPHAE